MESSALPQAAPLAAPLLTALIQAHLPRSSLAQDATRRALLAQLIPARTMVTHQLAALHHDGTVSVADAMRALALTGDTGRSVLSRWRGTGLLRPSTPRTRVWVDSVAGLLLTRTLWPLERVHLPDIPPTEPAWWCWRQDTPDAPILPCPVPLPAEVPPTARLWSPWAGAPWIDARIAVDDTSPPT